MSHFWWYVARSSGFVAWVFLVASLMLGVIASGRLAERARLRRYVLDLHPWVSGLAIGAVALHVAAIVADSYVEITPVQALVPFASPWRPAAVALGTVGLWMMLVIQATSLVRRHISRQVWYAIHTSSYALAVLVTLHVLLAGSDVAALPVRIGVGALVAALVGLTLLRVLVPPAPREEAAPRPAAPGPRPATPRTAAPGSRYPSAPPTAAPSTAARPPDAHRRPPD